MAQACGVKWVLPKPSEPETILSTVQEALGVPAAVSDSPAPKLSASLEAEKFSSIKDQLQQYLLDLGSAGDLMSEIDAAGTGTGLDSERDNLRRIGEKMAVSLGTLQAVSMRLTRLVELGLDLAAERNPARMLEI